MIRAYRSWGLWGLLLAVGCDDDLPTRLRLFSSEREMLVNDHAWVTVERQRGATVACVRVEVAGGGTLEAPGTPDTNVADAMLTEGERRWSVRATMLGAIRVRASERPCPDGGGCDCEHATGPEGVDAWMTIPVVVERTATPADTGVADAGVADVGVADAAADTGVVDAGVADAPDGAVDATPDDLGGGA